MCRITFPRLRSQELLTNYFLLTIQKRESADPTALIVPNIVLPGSNPIDPLQTPINNATVLETRYSLTLDAPPAVPSGGFPSRSLLVLCILGAARYERIFVALIMGVTALGRTPRCVLEVPDFGEERSRRINAKLSHPDRTSCGDQRRYPD